MKTVKFLTLIWILLYAISINAQNPHYKHNNRESNYKLSDELHNNHFDGIDLKNSKLYVIPNDKDYGDYEIDIPYHHTSSLSFEYMNKKKHMYSYPNRYKESSIMEEYVYLALSFIFASVIIVANDFYIYPTYSFYRDNKETIGSSNTYGLVFGLRKTFKNSAIEYGASFLRTIYNSRYDSYINKTERWGGHLNYTQQIFYNKTPDWLKFYVGPSINYVHNLGYGGIVGAKIKLFDRLKFDIRYEQSTQTKQIQLGFIFTYQKKYFWNK